MSWKNIIKAPSKKDRAIVIDKVMADGEKRTINEILEKIVDMKVDKRIGVPTRRELITYLSKNYTSAVFDILTGKQLKVNRNMPYHKRKYWRV
jgi:hypothetical protein